MTKTDGGAHPASY